MTGVDPREELRTYVELIFPELEKSSYYQLLEVPASAPSEDIKKRFYEQAVRLHPDRHYGQLPDNLFAKLVVVYARMAEGYRILHDTARRTQYDRGLKLGKLRATVVEKELGRDPELDLENLQARKFYKMAVEAMKKSDWKSAALQLGFALQSEPTSLMLNGLLEECQANLKK